MSENLRSPGILSVVPPGRDGLDSLTLGDIFCRALRLSVVSGPGGMDHLAVGEPLCILVLDFGRCDRPLYFDFGEGPAFKDLSENLRSPGILSVVPPGRDGLDSLTLGDIFCRALRLSVVSGPGGMDHLAVGEPLCILVLDFGRCDRPL